MQDKLPKEIERRMDQARKRFATHVRIIILSLSIVGYLTGLIFGIWTALCLMIVFSVVGTNIFMLRSEKYDYYGVKALQDQQRRAQASS